MQPMLGFLVAGGLVFMAWLSRELENRDISPYAYPGIVFGLLIAGTGLFALLLPDLFGFFYNQIDRVFGFITSPGTATGTIGEAQPPDQRLGYLYDNYHFAVVTAAIGAAIVIGRQFFSRERNGEELLVLVWAAFLVAATWTQLRFGNYLAVPIGALNAVFVGFLMKLVSSASTDDVSIEPYQVMTIGAVVLIMFAPFLGFPLISAESTAVEFADQYSEPRDVVAWDDGLEFLEENTPPQGQYANPDGEKLDLYGTFGQTNDYEYPDGTYGVLSWWDYGHWITAESERIPAANPFQQGAPTAAEFLLAQDEEEAIETLEDDFDEGESAQTRYVMVDWKMVETENGVGGKYFAPIDFLEEWDRSDFYNYVYTSEQISNRQELIQQRTIAHNQPYYESMAVRLYHNHGSYREPAPVGITRAPAGNQAPIQAFNSTQQAQQWADQSPRRTVGGVGPNPTEPVEALEHFRLVHVSDSPATTLGQEQRVRDLADSGVFFGKQQVLARDAAKFNQQGAAAQFLLGPNPTWTKTFERVPGATIEGTGPANQELTLSTQLQPDGGDRFRYQQVIETDENGEFETTVPYATEGYDEYGVDEGYTNSTVRALSNYTIQSTPTQENASDGEGQVLTRYTANADVTEAQVIGEDDSAVQVTLEEESSPINIDRGTGDGQTDSDGQEESEDGQQEDNQSGDDQQTDDQESDSQQDEEQTQSIRTIAN